MAIRPRLLFTLFRRDLLPAGTGSGWRQFFGYRFWILILPTLGIFTFLFLAISGSLAIMAEGATLRGRMAELRTSPYMALFAEGKFFLDLKDADRRLKAVELDYWQRLTVQQALPEKSWAPHQGEQPVFAGIFLFTWATLHVVRKDRQTLPFRRGMALPLDGERADAALAEAIAKQLHEKDLPGLKNLDRGLIVSAEALKKYGFEEVPPYLTIYTRNDEPLSLPVFDVAERLPYQFEFILPIQEWQRMETGYYTQTIQRLTIGLEEQDYRTRQQEIQLMEGARWETPYLDGGLAICPLTLSRPVSRAEALNFVRDFPFIRRLELENHTWKKRDTLFDGAIFHLNFEPLELERMINDNLVLELQSFMATRDVNVMGELAQAIQENLKDQRYMERLEDVFRKALIGLTLAMLVLFALVLHTRMHRIGIFRMLGVSDISFFLLYIGEALFFCLTALIFAVGLFMFSGAIQSPFVQGLIRWDLLANIFFAALAGFLLPTLIFFHALQPAEMLSYRA